MEDSEEDDFNLENDSDTKSSVSDEVSKTDWDSQYVSEESSHFEEQNSALNHDSQNNSDDGRSESEELWFSCKSPGSAVYEMKTSPYSNSDSILGENSNLSAAEGLCSENDNSEETPDYLDLIESDSENRVLDIMPKRDEKSPPESISIHDSDSEYDSPQTQHIWSDSDITDIDELQVNSELSPYFESDGKHSQDNNSPSIDSNVMGDEYYNQHKSEDGEYKNEDTEDNNSDVEKSVDFYSKKSCDLQVNSEHSSNSESDCGHSRVRANEPSSESNPVGKDCFNQNEPADWCINFQNYNNEADNSDVEEDYCLNVPSNDWLVTSEPNAVANNEAHNFVEDEFSSQPEPEDDCIDILSEDSEAGNSDVEVDFAINLPSDAEDAEQSSDNIMSSPWESNSESELAAEVLVTKPKVTKHDASTSCTELNDHYNQIKNVFKIMNQDRKESTFCDLVIKVDEKSFNVHKGILKSQSPYFEMMFTGPFIEANTNNITLNGFTANTFETVLEYLYGTPIQSILNSDNLCDVSMAADMLCIEPLLNHCKRYLVENCSSIDMINCYILAKHLSMLSVVDNILNKMLDVEFENMSTETLRHLFFDLKIQSKYEAQRLTIVYYLIKEQPKVCLSIVKELMPNIALENIPDQYVDRFITNLKKILPTNTVIRVKIIMENVTRLGRQKVSLLNLQILGLDDDNIFLHVMQFDFIHWKWIVSNNYHKLKTTELGKGYTLVNEKKFQKSFGQDAKNKINLTYEEILASIPENVLRELKLKEILDVTMVYEKEFLCLSLEEFPGGWSYVVLNRIFRSTSPNKSTADTINESFIVERLCALPHFCTPMLLTNKEHFRCLITVFDDLKSR